jgi:tetrahydromethanopterin S-methyltransferase subunit A
MSLDWDAQKWKARYLVNDETSYAALRGSALLAVSVLVAKELGTTIERIIVQIFSAPAKRVVTAMGPQIVGAVTGSAVEPGVGTLAGWLIGAGGALAFDYLSNTYREYLDRPEFEKISAEALSVTMDEWSRAIRRDLFTAVDAWFDDTRTIVAEQKIRKN